MLQVWFSGFSYDKQNKSDSYGEILRAGGKIHGRSERRTAFGGTGGRAFHRAEGKKEYGDTRKAAKKLKTISTFWKRLSSIFSGAFKIFINIYTKITEELMSYFAKYSDCKDKANPTDIVCNAAVEYGYSRTALEQRLKAKVWAMRYDRERLLRSSPCQQAQKP